MSSRICRNRPSEEAPPIQWRVSGAAATVRPAQKQTGAADEGREIEAKLTAAYQQGVAAGEASAAQQAQARLDPAIASFGAIVSEVAGYRKRFRSEAEEATVNLAMAIAR